ncbi:MAG TPA: glycerol-3-phosphate acyltransferase [Acidimicrobiales bacterium]|nr:glycerol-3-phosphate acyltransferase [Acidimicrobiales bacterium]
MRSLSAVALLAGPMVLGGYVAGTAVAHLLARDDEPGPRPADLVLEAFATLAISTAAWYAIQQVSPGSGFSRIGYFSNQVLAAWQSVALWTGLAVVVGICAPVTRRFRGGPGLAPAGALLAAHFPWFLFASLGAGTVAFGASRSRRVASGAAIAVLLPTAWLGWVLEWLPAWGLPAGPEATVWSMVVVIVLGTRWWHDRPLGATW